MDNLNRVVAYTGRRKLAVVAVVGSLYRKEEIGSSGCGGQLIQEGGNWQ